MPQVSVTINGRRFRMACENGEEPLKWLPQAHSWATLVLIGEDGAGPSLS